MEVSANAAALIGDHVRKKGEPNGGFRIQRGQDQEPGELKVGYVPAPTPGDTVIASSDAPVFVADDAVGLGGSVRTRCPQGRKGVPTLPPLTDAAQPSMTTSRTLPCRNCWSRMTIRPLRDRRSRGRSTKRRLEVTACCCSTRSRRSQSGNLLRSRWIRLRYGITSRICCGLRGASPSRSGNPTSDPPRHRTPRRRDRRDRSGIRRRHDRARDEHARPAVRNRPRNDQRHVLHDAKRPVVAAPECWRPGRSARDPQRCQAGDDGVVDLVDRRGAVDDLEDSAPHVPPRTASTVSRTAQGDDPRLRRRRRHVPPRMARARRRAFATSSGTWSHTARWSDRGTRPSSSAAICTVVQRESVERDDAVGPERREMIVQRRHHDVGRYQPTVSLRAANLMSQLVGLGCP